MTHNIIPGLHHVTAISGAPQENIDFYVKTIGQRLVKKTVNFDEPGTYHFYFGDNAGSPGSILTFFPFADAGPGRAGPGMASAVAYGVPLGGLDRWIDFFADEAIECDGPAMRLGERALTLSDPHGLRIELIEPNNAALSDTSDAGFHSVTLWLQDTDPTARLLVEQFGYEEAGHERTEDGERIRFQSPAHARGSIVDLLRSDHASIGRQGAGAIHHVAFRAETDEIQKDWQGKLRDAGYDVTDVINRQYFNAIYFREPGGVLFEIATDPPGFAVDEPSETMGAELMLPSQYEGMRERIEQILPPIRVPNR
ncbi:MAG: ring-cleaving dioxygenase [Pseudomonadota bacterium]